MLEDKIRKLITNCKKSLLDMSKRNRLFWYKSSPHNSLKLNNDNLDSQSDPLKIVQALINEEEEIKFKVSLPKIPVPPTEVLPDYLVRQQEYEQIKNEFEKIKLRNKTLEMIRRKIKIEHDEKGLNTGYIAAGFLQWYEREDSTKEVKSPLIMIPVKVEQTDRTSPIIISLNNDEEITINPIIKKKFELDFKINFDDNDFDFHNLEAVLQNIQNMVKEQEKWAVNEEIFLDVFNFQNLVIWNDFDKNSQLFCNHKFGQFLVGAELSDLGMTYEENIDLQQIDSKNNLCILETDSSQLEVVRRVRNGESFVIQGPPGTGKSQTIVNIIAEQLYLGKKILFVSEKQAALDVVYHKLEQKGLSNFCLIMHNARQRKTDVRKQLQESLDLAENKQQVKDEAMATYNCVDKQKKVLNLYSNQLHSHLENQITPFQILAQLARLNQTKDLVFEMPKQFNWQADYFKEIQAIFDAVGNYAHTFIDDTHHFDHNYWRYYTGDFASSTRRKIEETINEININSLQKVIWDFKTTTSENIDIYSIINHLEKYNNLLAKIPFIQARTDNLEKKIKKINTYKSKILELNKKSQEFQQAASIFQKEKQEEIIATSNQTNNLKKEIKEFFLDDFFQLTDAENTYKILKNKYDSFLSRFGNNYKIFIAKIEQLTTAKLKYSDYLIYLTKLNTINANTNQIADTNELIREKNKQTTQDLEKSNQNIRKVNNDLAAELKNTEKTLMESFQSMQDLLNQLDFNKLLEYQKYYETRSILINQYHLDNFINTVENKEKVFNSSEILDIFKKRYFQLSLEITAFGKKYHNYSRTDHDNDVNFFREYDKKALEISTLRIKCALLSKLPDISGFNQNKQGGEIGLLRHELKKKSKLMPTRKLIEKLPTIIPQLKPCMMMSPLTVSSYFSTNTAWEFDLVIFDEASQVKPEYAIPAIVRGKQIVVAGDSKQMPPTNFFDKLSSDDDDYNEEDEGSEGLESILDLLSEKLPDKCLSWHYRSKDESLIAFSNKNFYNSKLMTFPSASKKDCGINYIYCPNGIWNNKSGNQEEAELVARMIFQHIQDKPERSLGVIAFGIVHANAIEDAVNKIRDAHPELETFFSETKKEPFFIKNLERVQGDERDRIILSCGYGTDDKGVFAMRFGPLASTGGERRLNVAISRAKYEMSVVSSFNATEIRQVDKQPNRKLLRDFINYAQHGTKALFKEQSEIGEEAHQPEFDSDFEEEVYNFLTEKGYSVETQVGSSGYKIDLAILHPMMKDQFVLAIECDGAAYHSSRTARDRDILRQSILENLGWKFYRIWSTNWFYDNFNEKKLLVEYINNSIHDCDTVGQHVKSEKTQEENNFLELATNIKNNNLNDFYKKYNQKLKKEHNCEKKDWNSAEIMETNLDDIIIILEEVIKHKNGYDPKDVFKEINENIFERSKLTSKLKSVYDEALLQLIKKDVLEIINDSIRLK